MHRVFGKLHICHILVLDMIIYDIACLNHVLHVVLYEDHKISTKETGFWHITLSNLCASHHYPIKHDTLVLFTSL